MNTEDTRQAPSADQRPSGNISLSDALTREFVLPSASSHDSISETKHLVIHRMGFRVGDIGLLYPQDGSREVTKLPTLNFIPNTASWMIGLVNIRGGLVPVVDLSLALDVERDRSKEPYLLVFGHNDESIGLLIEGLPERKTIPTEQKLSSLPPVPQRLEPVATAAYDYEDLVWIDIQIKNFFERLTEEIAI
ncbi:MAG: chemotaxis protein CheW [Gammaproteobacteria bacterium]|nr:chemotaxis protein CheW [Gammaproteobacteria bacterium]MDH5801616.1 chemotaxis protein CheW [Gammaproteobacteria bacterium]